MGNDLHLMVTVKTATLVDRIKARIVAIENMNARREEDYKRRVNEWRKRMVHFLQTKAVQRIERVPPKDLERYSFDCLEGKPKLPERPKALGLRSLRVALKQLELHEKPTISLTHDQAKAYFDGDES